MKFGEIKNELSICFVVFADILGYREKIQKCNDDYYALKRELEDFKLKILDPQDQLTRMIESSGGIVSIFSDSIYIHVPIPSDNPESFDDGRPQICSPIEDLGMYQYNLALQGIFIRGGAALNYGFVDKSIAFGPGMLNAFDCEQKADYPRICLTEEAVFIIRHYIENQWPGDERINKFVLRGEDGKFFINYLQTIVDIIEETCDNIPDDGKEYPLYRNVPFAVEQINKHKENIEMYLKESTKPSIRNKFIWLANYHNYFCKRHFQGLDSVLISAYQENFYQISPKQT